MRYIFSVILILIFFKMVLTLKMKKEAIPLKDQSIL